MGVDLVLGAILAIGLAILFGAALVRPERF
jgi:hypothetical protein